MDNILHEFKKVQRDFSVSASIAGLVAALVGMTSSAVLVFQAAEAAGVSPEASSSWLGAVCVGTGILSIIFSVWTKVPILIAWSTPGAVLIAESAAGASIQEIVGAFLFSAFVMVLMGATGLFEKVMNKVPLALAAALLSGILLHYSLESVLAIKTEPLLMLAMFVTYFCGRKYFPRYVMMAVLGVGVFAAELRGLLHFEHFHLSVAHFHYTHPDLSFKALLSIGLPLCLVTMASQNITGATAIRTQGFRVPLSPILSWVGFMNILIAPLGGFAINLAALTATIALGHDCHPAPSKRYVAGIVWGFLFIMIGVFAGTVTSMFAAFPQELILGIAGLALIPTISLCVKKTLEDEYYAEAAFITFMVTASGLSVLGIGSAFWGLLAGIAVQIFLSV